MNYLKAFVGLSILVFLALIHFEVIDIQQLLDWVEQNKDTQAGVILFLVLFTFLPLFIFPTAPLNILAGYLWGTLIGFGLSFIGGFLGAVVPFFIARYLLKSTILGWVEQKKDNLLLQRAMEANWKIVAITRLNPIFPSPVLSYLFGATKVRFRDYSLSTIIFSLPPAFALSLIGESVQKVIHSIMLVLGALTVLSALWLFKPYILKAISKE